MDKVHFRINGEPHTLDGTEVSTDTTLFEYLRYHASLCGTKAMCHEGGCGACVVAVSRTHPTTRETELIAVNSCLVYVHSCSEWEITTIEGIGSRRVGHHPLQKRLADFNGTQCGYCSPGMVMNMYSLSKGGQKSLTKKEIEDSFGGNMCRCTGYRPILDAFKSFASDSTCVLKKGYDIEDLANVRCTVKCSKPCALNSISEEWTVIEKDEDIKIAMRSLESKWYKATTLDDVFDIFEKEGDESEYLLVNGNTGQGVFPSFDVPKLIIDISSISAMREVRRDVNLQFGAGMSLAELMNAFKWWSKKSLNFFYLDVLAKHLELVAHVPVRNIATIGGNLALKNQHKNFASDVFLLLATVGATVSTVDNSTIKFQYRVEDLLKIDLKGSVIVDVKVPPLSSNNYILTYKIMPRAQNSHAIMNAGFLFKLSDKQKVLETNIIYGAVSSDFVHAKETEKLLKGQILFENATLQKCLAKLNKEIVPAMEYDKSPPIVKKMLALGLFYKALLKLAPDNKVDPRYKSGGYIFERPVSSGTQTYNTDRRLWPLNQPIPKIEALAQCSGEAHYADDVSSNPREVHVALVLSTIFKGEIDVIDATDVLKIPGVLAVLTAKDIPGKNSFSFPSIVEQNVEEEEIITSTKVLYHGQVIGLVAAKTRRLALRAAQEVKVTYKNITADKPVLSIRDALKAPDSRKRVFEDLQMDPTDNGTNTTKVLKGSYHVPTQYHYYMETQTCRASVSEFGVDIVASTQWVDAANGTVAKMLNIKENMVNIKVKRVGGAYGGKASRASQFICACALVAYNLDRPARLVLPIRDNMAAVGKRQDCLADYEVGIDVFGIIQYMDLKYYSNLGCNHNDKSTAHIGPTMAKFYEGSRWKVRGYSVLTDTAPNTWCRAPGTTEAAAIIEHIMERISYATKIDPTIVRMQNMGENHDKLKEMIISFKRDCDFNKRRDAIAKFNTENAWRKRSIRLISMAFPLITGGNFGATISVYHGDGSVAISHAGIEMGQGINTKVAQVCAHTFKIPLEMVTVKPSTNFTSPNSMVTSGSFTSEVVAFATVRACQILLRRLDPIADNLNDPTWAEIVKKAYDKTIDLQVTYMISDNDIFKEYVIYGVAIAEVELDALTARHEVLRVDILEDTGESISPIIDVGQVEGAFIMGAGMWTSESMMFHPETGRLLSDRTWTYKPPGAKDIPMDLRIVFPEYTGDNLRAIRSKATGEPALLMSVVITHALHDAIMQARKEFGYDDKEWVHIDTPYSVDNIMLGIAPKFRCFNFEK